MRTRRRYIALAGAALGSLAGCLGGGSSGDDPETPDSTPDTTVPGTTGTTVGTTETPDGSDDFSVTDLAVETAVTFYEWPGSTTVLAPDDRQFVLATVDGPEEETAPQFTFEADGESWDPSIRGGQHGPESVVDDRRGGLVAGDQDPVGYLAFSVPAPLSAEEPRIVLEDGAATWGLSDAAVAELGRPSPTFALETLDVPETVTRGESLSVSLTVRNTSDVDGGFLTSVHWPTEGIADDDESTVVSGTVAAGETEPFTLDLGTGHSTDETERVPLTIEGCVSADRSVEVRVEES